MPSPHTFRRLLLGPGSFVVADALRKNRLEPRQLPVREGLRVIGAIGRLQRALQNIVRSGRARHGARVPVVRVGGASISSTIIFLRLGKNRDSHLVSLAIFRNQQPERGN
jgi:hypothetical protein